MYDTMYICYLSLVVSLSVHKLDNMLYPKVYGSHLTLYIKYYTPFQKYKKHISSIIRVLAKIIMPSVGDSIKVLSANCQGLQNIKKRIDVLSYFKETNANIVCLQDTHLIDDDIMVVKELWNNDVYLNGGKTNSRGVAILLNNNFEYEILACNKDKNGNYLNLLMKLSSMKINLITLYGPNNDNPSFF